MNVDIDRVLFSSTIYSDGYDIIGHSNVEKNILSEASKYSTIFRFDLPPYTVIKFYELENHVFFTKIEMAQKNDKTKRTPLYAHTIIIPFDGLDSTHHSLYKQFIEMKQEYPGLDKELEKITLVFESSDTIIKFITDIGNFKKKSGNKPIIKTLFNIFLSKKDGNEEEFIILLSDVEMIYEITDLFFKCYQFFTLFDRLPFVSFSSILEDPDRHMDLTLCEKGNQSSSLYERNANIIDIEGGETWSSDEEYVKMISEFLIDWIDTEDGEKTIKSFIEADNKDPINDLEKLLIFFIDKVQQEKYFVKALDRYFEHTPPNDFFEKVLEIIKNHIDTREWFSSWFISNLSKNVGRNLKGCAKNAIQSIGSTVKEYESLRSIYDTIRKEIGDDRFIVSFAETWKEYEKITPKGNSNLIDNFTEYFDEKIDDIYKGLKNFKNPHLRCLIYLIYSIYDEDKSERKEALLENIIDYADYQELLKCFSKENDILPDETLFEWYDSFSDRLLKSINKANEQSLSILIKWIFCTYSEDKEKINSNLEKMLQSNNVFINSLHKIYLDSKHKKEIGDWVKKHSKSLIKRRNEKTINNLADMFYEEKIEVPFDEDHIDIVTEILRKHLESEEYDIFIEKFLKMVLEVEYLKISNIQEFLIEYDIWVLTKLIEKTQNLVEKNFIQFKKENGKPNREFVNVVLLSLQLYEEMQTIDVSQIDDFVKWAIIISNNCLEREDEKFKDVFEGIFNRSISILQRIDELNQENKHRSDGKASAKNKLDHVQEKLNIRKNKNNNINRFVEEFTNNNKNLDIDTWETMIEIIYSRQIDFTHISKLFVDWASHIVRQDVYNMPDNPNNQLNFSKDFVRIYNIGHRYNIDSLKKELLESLYAHKDNVSFVELWVKILKELCIDDIPNFLESFKKWAIEKTKIYLGSGSTKKFDKIFEESTKIFLKYHIDLKPLWEIPIKNYNQVNGKKFLIIYDNLMRNEYARPKDKIIMKEYCDRWQMKTYNFSERNQSAFNPLKNLKR